MSKRIWSIVTLLALGTVTVTLQTLPAAPATKAASVKWSGGQVEASAIGFKARQGKMDITFTGNVQATAPGLDLQHADKAVAADVKGKSFDTIKANGNVRFIVRKAAAASGQTTDKASGKCDQITIYNKWNSKPTGEQRVLVADLVGNVYLTLTQTRKGAAGAAEEPMLLEGAHAQVWLTAEGLEGSVSGGAN